MTQNRKPMAVLCICVYMEMSCRQAALLVAFLFFGWICFAAQPLGQEAGAGEYGAEKVRRILQELSDNDPHGTAPSQTYEVTEEELNAYLLAQLGRQNQKAVETISILLKQGTFLTSVAVNADQLQFQGNDSYLGILLKGTQTLEIEGRLQAENGMATYLVQEARLSGITVPPILVNNLLSSLGKKNDPPFDPTQPFPMPYGIQSITFQPGNLMIETGE